MICNFFFIQLIDIIADNISQMTEYMTDDGWEHITDDGWLQMIDQMKNKRWFMNKISLCGYH